MKQETITIARVKAINPTVFFMLPIFCVLMMTYVCWGNAQAIIGIWGLAITFFASFHIGTFDIKVREEDQETSN